MRGPLYPTIHFLAAHPIVLILIGATIAILGALMPYAEKHLRPREYVYLGWAENMQSPALLDYQRFEWPYGENTVVLQVPEPRHLRVQGGPNVSAALMLLHPKAWGAEMWMGIEGMEPARRYHPHHNTNLSITVEDLGVSGKEISRQYLISYKEKATEYVIQGVEWWHTANWDETRRVQITKVSN